MSTDNTQPLSSAEPVPQPHGASTIQRIASRPAEVGGIPIHRLLPSRHRRTIGAWCFLDHAGPSVFEAGHGMRVGPHPHIGLQTFTWMIQGEILHRDSLGNEQIIRPGQVNLMTAGRGISHTEESLAQEQQLHATQLWIALPPDSASCEPAFDHHPVLPRWSEGGCNLTLLAGAFKGHRSPVRLYSPLVGIDLASTHGGEVELQLEPGFEYGIVGIEGDTHIANAERVAVNELAYLGQGRTTLPLRLSPGGRAVLLGGEPWPHEILFWWNFVGHSKAEIAQAQHDWETGHERFGRVDGYDGPPMSAPPLPWARKS